MNRRAHAYTVSFCGDPKCGPHIVALDENDDVICEIVMSVHGALNFMKFCQNELYVKATNRDKDSR